MNTSIRKRRRDRHPYIIEKRAEEKREKLEIARFVKRLEKRLLKQIAKDNKGRF